MRRPLLSRSLVAAIVFSLGSAIWARAQTEERSRQVEKVAAAAVRDWIEKHRSELAKPI